MVINLIVIPVRVRMYGFVNECAAALFPGNGVEILSRKDHFAPWSPSSRRRVSVVDALGQRRLITVPHQVINCH